MTSWFKQLLESRLLRCPLKQAEACPPLQGRQKKFSDRESELIDIAHKLVDANGFAGLTMDKLVAACNYSKGTVYNHFSCKEDLFIALSLTGIKYEKIILSDALKFDGNPREVALAMNYAFQLYSRLEPTLSQCIYHAKNPTVREKCSAERLEALNKEDTELLRMCDQVFLGGIEDGSLKLSPGLGIESFTFANWALTLGTSGLLNNGQTVHAISRIETRYALLRNINLLYDGMQWQPLSTQFDYFQTWNRLDQFFAEYVELLEANALSANN